MRPPKTVHSVWPALRQYSQSCCQSTKPTVEWEPFWKEKKKKTFENIQYENWSSYIFWFCWGFMLKVRLNLIGFSIRILKYIDFSNSFFPSTGPVSKLFWSAKRSSQNKIPSGQLTLWSDHWTAPNYFPPKTRRIASKIWSFRRSSCTCQQWMNP